MARYAFPFLMSSRCRPRRATCRQRRFGASPSAPRGIGSVCEVAADILEKSGTRFAAPAGVTPASLRTSGKRAEGIDQVILDLDVVLNKLKQGNLLLDAEAWEQIRKLNDQVKVQGKHDPEVLVMFKPVLDFFARVRPTATAPAPGGAVVQ